MGLKFARLQLCVQVCVSVCVSVSSLGGCKCVYFWRQLKTTRGLLRCDSQVSWRRRRRGRRSQSLGSGVVAGQAETCRDMQRRASSR